MPSLRIIAVPRTNSANGDDLDLQARRQGHDVIAHTAIAGWDSGSLSIGPGGLLRQGLELDITACIIERCLLQLDHWLVVRAVCDWSTVDMLALLVMQRDRISGRALGWQYHKDEIGENGPK